MNKTLPVLSRGTSGAKGEHLADLLAHLGWVDYLRELDGVRGWGSRAALSPCARGRSGQRLCARHVGLRNPRNRGSLAEAKQHFSAALESQREREYLRYLQISALLRIEDPERENEAIRVANEMRINGERKDKLKKSGTDYGEAVEYLLLTATVRYRNSRCSPRRTTWPRSAGSSRRTSWRAMISSCSSSSLLSCRSTAAIAPVRWRRTDGYYTRPPTPGSTVAG